ncbi:hypothetical protein EYC84_007025 [Monilinia fructicola]|uniref:Thioesterase domain-containing protein n=1 Tax=Monilinia fructicola TaxID=38448 RepID=A0A5M9K7Z5_MONFR|nr:hypothetical protein EYC84_007025 [Monilinia fructicola]
MEALRHQGISGRASTCQLHHYSSNMAALRFVRSVLRSFQESSGLEPRLFGENLRVTGAEPGRVDFELDIKKEHTNRLNIIHGEVFMPLVFLLNLNVTYLNPGGKVGDVLKAVVTCDKFGKTLAYTSIQFTNSKGEIAARGNTFALAWKEPKNIVEELSPRP